MLSTSAQTQLANGDQVRIYYVTPKFVVKSARVRVDPSSCGGIPWFLLKRGTFSDRVYLDTGDASAVYDDPEVAWIDATESLFEEMRELFFEGGIDVLSGLDDLVRAKKWCQQALIRVRKAIPDPQLFLLEPHYVLVDLIMTAEKSARALTKITRRIETLKPRRRISR